MSADELSAQLTLLCAGEVEMIGRMPWSSNATFLVRVTHDGRSQQAIYKPVRGERPLWDFAPGLHRRETAAFRLSESMGLGIVPATVIRDGPLGEGSFQWFVDADHEQHYFTMFEDHPHLHEQLRTIAMFDLLVNNTDRKSGHCLLDGDHVWAIDHGLCFAADFKLRTVIWDFAGDAIDAALLDRVRPLTRSVPLDTATLLADDEVEALRQRADLIVGLGHFPVDESGRRYPWPLV
jgi:uncharacterized repeat protein (TIGR03843 family)